MPAAARQAPSSSRERDVSRRDSAGRCIGGTDRGGHRACRRRRSGGGDHLRQGARRTRAAPAATGSSVCPTAHRRQVRAASCRRDRLCPGAASAMLPKQAIIAPQINPKAVPAPAGSARAAISGIGSEAGSLESEDCLNLTLYTPGIDSARRPVMVWLHGGGLLRRLRFQSHVRGIIAGRARRRGGRQREPPAQRARLRAPAGQRRGLRRLGQCRHHGPRAGAALGARQHRALRRRCQARAGLRPVRRRRQGRHAVVHALGARPVPSRCHPEWCDAPAAQRAGWRRRQRAAAEDAGAETGAGPRTAAAAAARS